MQLISSSIKLNVLNAHLLSSERIDDDNSGEVKQPARWSSSGPIALGEEPSRWSSSGPLPPSGSLFASRASSAGLYSRTASSNAHALALSSNSDLYYRIQMVGSGRFWLVEPGHAKSTAGGEPMAGVTTSPSLFSLWSLHAGSHGDFRRLVELKTGRELRAALPFIDDAYIARGMLDVSGRHGQVFIKKR